MAGGSKKKPSRNSVKAARGSAATTKNVPWVTITAVVGVLVLAIAVFAYYWVQSADERAQQERTEQAQAFAPSPQNHDPSKQIPGVVIKQYKGGAHVLPNERVAYNKFPPFGGPHDAFWAACTGVVYDEAVRNENMVHSLEHGAVWIAYNPKKISDDALELLKNRVKGEPFMMLSPYPGLDSPISLQSWGHQLKLKSAKDPRIDQFIAALKRNRYTYPEVGASCGALGPGRFDPDNPPPFNPTPPGPDAKPMTYDGSTGARQMGE